MEVDFYSELNAILVLRIKGEKWELINNGEDNESRSNKLNLNQSCRNYNCSIVPKLE